jgi:hypothetical protein
MRRFEEDRPSGALLSVADVSLGLIGLAFTLHTVHAAAGVFWVLIGGAAFIVLASVGTQFRRLNGARDARHELTGSECRRLSDAIGAVWSAQLAKRPRSIGLIASGEAKQKRWIEETDAAYDELKPWAMRVLAEAVACKALSNTSRPLVESPPAAQLYKVRDLFRDAADTLEHV